MAGKGLGGADSSVTVAAPTIPRTIWMLWFQGERKAPPVVRACLETWRRDNPGWTINVLSERTLERWVDLDAALSGRAGKTIEREALSDVVRICLLRRHGGVWADATVYCNRPLDDWLPDHTRTGFFAFSRPAPDRMIASWFLAAAPGDYVVEAWHRATLEYWAARSARDRYFWFHGLFERLYDDDPAFKSRWDAASPIPAAGPQWFVPYETALCGPMTDAARVAIERPEAPVFKLTHKLGSPSAPEGSPLAYLVERARPRSLWSAIRATLSPRQKR